MKYLQHKKYQLIILLLLVSLSVSFAQSNIVEMRSKYNSLGKFWVATFEGGVTLPFSDFQTPSIGYTGKAGIEYYFPSRIFLIPGLRLHASYGELNGESNTGRLSGDGSLRRVIKNFNTPFVLLEPSIVAAFGKNKVIPYLALGLDYLLAFIPLEKNGYSLYTNSKRSPFLTFSGEFGIRYFIHNDLSYNFSLKYIKGSVDELDGFVSRKKDACVMITSGISVHLFRKERIR